MKTNLPLSFVGLMVLSASTMLLAGCSHKGTLTVGERAEALDERAWIGSQWISVADSASGRAAEGASWFATTVRNEGKVVSARWMVSSLGVFDIYVNGQPVGEEVLRPGFTHPLKTRRSFTYDITRAFRCKAGAANVLAAQVTPGWWADEITLHNGREGEHVRRCAFRGVLELTFADGTTRRYGTDLTNWRAGVAGPVQRAGIFEGERYDARRLLGFETIDALSEPEANDGFRGQLLPSDGAEIYHRHDLALPVAKAYVYSKVVGAASDAFGKVVIDREYAATDEMTVRPGETLVVDFGQNAAAVPSFVFRAAEGAVLTCLPGELLNDGNGAHRRGMDGPEGSVHRQNLRTADRHMRVDYTFGPASDYVAYTPQHTFFGYRYVAITATDEVRIRSLRSIPVSSIAQQHETGTLVTGNADINRLLSNTLWGMRSNYLSVPTDCPQRNERQGWTADTQVFAETGTFFADTRAFFHKWMRDMRDTQSPEGGFPSVAPVGQYGDAGMMRLGWADAGVIVPWTVWKQFGDTAIVNENWEAMERYVQHINATRYDHVALSRENGNYQWGDWLSYEPLESCGGTAFNSNGPKPDAIVYWNFLSASYWAIDADMMADMASATGRPSQPYRDMASAARAYLRDTFLHADGRFKTDILNTMQTPALFVLRNHLLDGDAKATLVQRLRDNLAQHGNCLQTGFLGTSILMPTLTDNGMADLAFELLFQHKNPSWLYSIDNGATTIWERWNSYMADSGMGPQGMNSFNHYAYGCVCQWLWESVAGIAADPSSPGFRHIIMRPLPDPRLGHVEAEYHSTAGTIKSAWRYDGDHWTWTFTIPRGSTATVTLPGQTESKQYVSGTHKLTLML